MNEELLNNIVEIADKIKNHKDINEKSLLMLARQLYEKAIILNYESERQQSVSAEGANNAEDIDLNDLKKWSFNFSDTTTNNKEQPHTINIGDKKNEHKEPIHVDEKINSQEESDFEKSLFQQWKKTLDDFKSQDNKKDAEKIDINKFFESMANISGNKNTDRVKSVNDNFAKLTPLGLNDRIAFTKQLFDGRASEFDEAVDKLSSVKTVDEAITYIQNKIMPLHNNWANKEEYRERFEKWILSRFE